MGEYRVLGDPGLVGMLCFLSFLVLIATAVNAVFLRAAIAFNNWMAKVVGSPTPIEEPPLRVATTINLVTIPKLHFTRFGSKLYNLRTRWERRARDGQTNKSNQGAADHLVCG